MKDWQFGLLFGSLLGIQGHLTNGVLSIAFTVLSIAVLVFALFDLIWDD